MDISRHRELFEPYNFNTPVHIIGAGATGSWLALILAKLGIENITVWDFDKVEEHNISNQGYSIHDIGELKVEALKQLVHSDTGIEIKTKEEKVVDQRLSGVVFLMVDTMKSRKEIWENCIKMKSRVKLLVEPRMGVDVGRIYNVNPTDLTEIEKYENTYYSDDVGEVSACGNSLSIITSAMTIASWCGRQLIEFHNGNELDNEILFDLKFNNLISSKFKTKTTV